MNHYEWCWLKRAEIGDGECEHNKRVSGFPDSSCRRAIRRIIVWDRFSSIAELRQMTASRTLNRVGTWRIADNPRIRFVNSGCMICALGLDGLWLNSRYRNSILEAASSGCTPSLESFSKEPLNRRESRSKLQILGVQRSPLVVG